MKCKQKKKNVSTFAVIAALVMLLPVLCLGNQSDPLIPINPLNDYSTTNLYWSNFQKSKTGYPIRPVALLINPLGILQFGPILQMEFRTGSGFVLGPSVRFAGFGLLTHIVNDYDETDLSSMAFGFSFKGLIGPSHKPHKFYVGALTEYGWGSGRDDDYWESEYTNKYITIFANLGYRWRFRSGMFLNLGAFLGVVYVFEDKSDYVDYGSQVIPLPMLELSFGWEF
jgi:hypothetical protein